MNREIIVNLWHALRERFNQSELRDLCFNLKVEYDDLPDDTISDKMRELITYLNRRDRIPDLLEAVEKMRPEISLEGIKSFTGEMECSNVDQYIAQISNLLREDDTQVIGSLGRSYTLDICRSLDPAEKGRVLRFIYDAKLIDKESPVIDLQGIDLSSANLVKTNLLNARLSGVNLQSAELESADLTRADLRASDLRQCNFKNAVLSGASLKGADLRKAVLNGADLEGAVKRAGQVKAGTGSVLCDFELEEGEIYSFVVTGESMEQADIYSGDTVIVQASFDEPAEGERIVTMYLPWKPLSKTIGDSSLQFYTDEAFEGPIIKTFQGRGDPEGAFRLQGWETKHKIITSRIAVIGKVVTTLRTSPMRCNAEKDSHEREFVDLTKGEIVE